MDRRTGGQRDIGPQHVPRCAYASCGKNVWHVWLRPQLTEVIFGSLAECRVYSLTDCKYSLNPLSQTQIDLSRTKSNSVNVQTELYMACMVFIRRIVTYKIFINKQFKHIMLQ